MLSSTLPRLKREGGISFEMPQWKRAPSRIEGRISQFFSSCCRKLGVPLELRWGLQGPACVASGKSSLHVSCEEHLGINLQSLPGLQSASGLEARISGSSRVSRASSRVETCKTAFLSSFQRSVRLPVELT